ncbi:MAG: tRNA lysidine(34) synthetase TilS [Actinobacteria bacterium]|nr:tRNA lysidine(34) synthetase TilS [Actinomycetota bacterium]
MTRLPQLDPAVAECRVAVRRTLAECIRPPADDEGWGGRLVLVALSGGADSLALAAAAAFEAPRVGLRAGAVVVDHGLQQGSAEVADRAAQQARGLGLEPVVVRRVSVPERDSTGPEGAARAARYAAIEMVRAECGAVAVLTGHTKDDQAEQVLLALARGSGTRAVAGIPPARDAILRPLLGVSRTTTERACAAQGLEPWRDPHNADPVYTRVRVRERILPLLEHELGPGIAANLARSAELAREDADALDVLAREAYDAAMSEESGAPPRLDIAALATLPLALRHRVIRHAARIAFGTSLTREHALAVAALITDWHGQGPIHVPGGEVRRSGMYLILMSSSPR